MACFPYQWRIVNGGNVIQNWSAPISDRSSQSATNVPLSSTVEFIDNEGYTWSDGLSSTLPVPYSTYGSNYSYSTPITNGYYHGYIYLYFNSGFPIGTRFEYVSGPAASIPIHQDVTLTQQITQFFPFSQNYTQLYTSDYAYIEPGIYTFNIYRPGCAVQTMNVSYYAYKLISPFTYTVTEVCDGLEVRPTGGQVDQISYTGAVYTSYTNMYYRINSSIPSGLPYNSSAYVQQGGVLKLPQGGKYVVGMSLSSGANSTLSYVDTITYTPTPFTLDNTVTSSYLCQGSSTGGFIRVKGSGGSGNYWYELYDNGVMVANNGTGVFNYGTAGSTYTIKLYDNSCMLSYPQDVTLLDLGIAQIAYSSKPDNKFCLTDSVYLKCLTLGQTTYLWSGPGFDVTNQNIQNPALFAGDLGVGTHIFTVRVTPENCGVQMQQTVTITIADCRPVADSALIIANGATICAGDPITLSASLTSSVIQDPLFSWYMAPTGGAAFHTGTSYTPSPSITTTTTYYVSVKGSSHQESERKAVTVTVKPFSTPDMIKITVN
jgi:hypothetical protein